MSNFDFNPLICDAILFPGKNSSNIANNNRIFPGKGRGDTALILTYFGSPVAEMFPHYCLSFSILAILREERVVKVGPKVQTLGPSLVHENSNPSIFFQAMLLFARVLPLMRTSAVDDHIRGSKGPKTSQKGPFYRY